MTERGKKRRRDLSRLRYIPRRRKEEEGPLWASFLLFLEKGRGGGPLFSSLLLSSLRS